MNTILKCTCGTYTMNKDHCETDSAISPRPARYRPEFKHKDARAAARKEKVHTQYRL